MMSIQELAQQERIPKKFLEQVLLALKKAGILQSSRGKTGGYSLSRPPAEVSLADIMQAVDGPLLLLPCLAPTSPVKCSDCVSLDHCWLRAIMANVGAGILTALESVSLAEVCRRAARSQRRSTTAAMYHI
jgi:Rrf2 family protein